MNTTTNSQNFPQFSQGTASNTEIPFSFEIKNFRFHPSIQNRPFEIESMENENYGMQLFFTLIGLLLTDIIHCFRDLDIKRIPFRCHLR